MLRPMLMFRANPGLILAALISAAGCGFAVAQEPQVTPPQSGAAPVLPTTASPAPASTVPVSPASAGAPLAGSGDSPSPTGAANAIAIVSTEDVDLTGALKVSEGKAIIGKSGTITAGKHTATVLLPRRGELYLCATSKVNLTTDSSVPTSDVPGDAPGLMMAIDKGALEAKFATGKNSDVVLTPDFRILISGPGVADVQVRLGQRGDTCVDNSGPDAPYVAVSSVFDGGVYRVQPGQRVMFQHGSLTEVVDNERESCGCPPEAPTIPTGNDFPVAQSAGIAPVLPSTLTSGEGSGGSSAQAHATLTHNASEPNPLAEAKPETTKPQAGSTKPNAVVPPATLADAAADAAKPAPKPLNMGPAHRFGRFLKRLFGG
jgi:hypothetical protein